MKIITIVLIIIVLAFVLYLTKEKFTTNGNIIKEVNNIKNIKLPYNAKMTGFKLESEDKIKYNISFDNEYLSEYNQKLALLPNQFYPFNKSVEQIKIDIIDLEDNSENNKSTTPESEVISTTPESEVITTTNKKIFKLIIYGIYENFNKIDRLDVSKGTIDKSNQFTISFDKVSSSNVSNILYYFISLVKYDYEKNFINNQIIKINNYELNFSAELEKLDLEGLTIDKNTELKDIKNVDNKDLKLGLYKLIINYKFFNVSRTSDLSIKVFNIIKEINDIAEFKMDIANYNGDDNIKLIINDFKNNIFYNQSDEIKALLEYLYELLRSVEDCMENCSYTLNNLESVDINGNKLFYKIGVGYVRRDINGNDVMSEITSFRDSKGEQLLTFVEEKEKHFNTDNIYNKLIKSSSTIDFEGNFPNDFLPTEDYLNKYVNMTTNTLEQDGKQVGILDIVVPNIDVHINLK